MMKQKYWYFIGFGLLLCLFVPFVHGEKPVKEKGRHRHKGLHRFKKADTNNDRKLSKDEWSAMKPKKAAEGLWEFEDVDQDGDGSIVPEEIKTYHQSVSGGGERKLKEFIDKKKLSKEELAEYLQKHPKLAAALLRRKGWLEKHPEVAEHLLNNNKLLYKDKSLVNALWKNKEFLNKHPKLAEKVFSDKDFLQKHPGIADEIRKDNAFMKKHPNLNKRIRVKSHKARAKGK